MLVLLRCFRILVQEMRSLHHEIEALQSRILARLNSNPSDLSAHTERIPSH